MKNLLRECRSYLKLGVLGQAMALLLASSALVHTAAVPVGAHAAAAAVQEVRVTVDGSPYDGQAILYGDTTYVELNELCAAVMPMELAVFDGTAAGRAPGLEIRTSDGSVILEANGRALHCPRGVFVRGNAVYVPLRAAMRALGGTVEWEEATFTAHVIPSGIPIQSGDAFYNADELYWLARIIYAEAGAEPFDGQIAVGNVVLNRVRNEMFPDTVYGVIFDRSWGVQFTPTANGMIYREPDAEAVLAAKLCLEGYSLSGEILYFLNAALAANLWVPQNRRYVMTISGHDFYA